MGQPQRAGRIDFHDAGSLPQHFTMKQETGIAKFILDDSSAVEIAMLDWIDGWYNARRRHSSIGYLSPLQYEHHLARQADQTALQAA